MTGWAAALGLLAVGTLVYRAWSRTQVTRTALLAALYTRNARTFAELRAHAPGQSTGYAAAALATLIESGYVERHEELGAPARYRLTMAGADLATASLRGDVVRAERGRYGDRR